MRKAIIRAGRSLRASITIGLRMFVGAVLGGVIGVIASGAVSTVILVLANVSRDAVTRDVLQGLAVVLGVGLFVVAIAYSASMVWASAVADEAMEYLDRIAATRECVHCGYSLRGLPLVDDEVYCPECGQGTTAAHLILAEGGGRSGLDERGESQE